MRTKKIFRILFALLLTVLIFSCAVTNTAEIKASPEFVQGHTRGEISSRSGITVVFSLPLGQEGEEISSPFAIKPAIPGTARWSDSRTLTFLPARPLENDTGYQVTFKTDVLKAALPDQTNNLKGFTDFSFDIRVIRQELVMGEGILFIPDPDEPDLMEYQAEIAAADSITLEQVESLIHADYENSPAELKITARENENRFDIRIPRLSKGEKSENLKISLSGEARSARGEKKVDVRIPPRDEFSVLSVNPSIRGEKYVEILFSSPLSETQDLRGLITVKEIPDIQLVSRSNRVKIYSSGSWPNNLEVIVNREIKDRTSRILVSASTVSVVFPTEKPAVRFTGEGVILPTTKGTTIPVETMNLNSIMVEAVQIHSRNIPQFLQINNLDESEEIHRVGETVWRKVIPLNWRPENADRWIRHGLDLSPLLEKYPEGFFQIKLTFRRPHIEYECTSDSTSQQEEDLPDQWTGVQGTETDAESSYWDSVESSQSWEYRQYRNDPCHPAYYQVWYDHDIESRKNVFVSNLGILAMREKNGRLQGVITDIRNTAPLAGVTVEAYNYQNRLLAQGVTDQAGLVSLDPEDEPFFLLAKHGTQRGYLRMNSASVRTTSHFDTGGFINPDGLMGFFYGERGVWRPGDRVHLNFILKDTEDILPADHPLIFQLLDPWGKEVDRLVTAENVNGFYTFYAQTDEVAPTGNYLARARAGGRVFEKQIKIETIMPNRLKVDLHFENEETGLSNGPYTGSLNSAWLHGAPASGLKADITARFAPSTTSFSGYDAYVFDDPAREILAEEQTIFEGSLDALGETKISGEINTAGAPGKLNVIMTTRIFEPGGAFSTEQIALPYHPFEQYAGLKLPQGDAARGMLLTDQDQRVDIVLVDKTGKPVPTGEVTAEVYKLNWRWWWETEEENLVSYVSRSSLAPIHREEVPIFGGKGSWSFQINYPDWGRYLVRITDRKGNHSTGKVVYIDWPGWAGRAQEEGSGSAAMLVLTSDKPGYTPGEEMTISVPTGTGGRGRILLEKGGKIIHARWFEGRQAITQISIKAGAEMAPNIYAHVTYLQPHLQAVNDRPVRTYGVIPIRVEDPASHLKPEITASRTFRPEEKARITVREVSGQPMTYTLAVVDEGLLGITRFNPADPWDYFYQREASLVQTWDIYDHVAGAFSGVLNTLLAVGGGGGGDDEAGGRKTNRFAPVVEVLPPVFLPAGESNSHEILIPRYIGAVRVMVTAGNEKAFGTAQKEVQVKKELMVLGTLPRVLSINESVELPVTLFALDDRIHEAEISLETRGSLFLAGEDSRTITIPPEGEARTSFRLGATGKAGSGLVTIRARANGFSAVQEIPLEIRIPSAPVSVTEDAEIPPGGRWTGIINLPGIPGSNSLVVETSRIPPLDLERRLSFLLEYPHGCIEQITSRAFPQLYLPELTDLTEDQHARQQSNIQGALSSLKGFQIYTGGFSYWPGEGEPNTWASNYAGHFLLEAERKGFFLPPGMKSKWISFQKTESSRWDSGSIEEMRTQAYRLYTLALAGETDLPSMNRLRETRDLDPAAAWRLAMAYHLSGYRREALEMTAGLTSQGKSYRETGGTYGSEFRDLAMNLEALVLMRRRPEALRLARNISEVLSGGKSLSTQETGYALLAMAAFSSALGEPGTVSLEYSWNNGPWQKLTSDKPVVQGEIDPGDSLSGQLTIKNTGPQVLFPRIITRGTPEPGRETALSQGLRLAVSYSSEDETGAVDPAHLKQGRDLKIKVTLENRTAETLEEIAVSHLLPPGWEIHNERIGGETGSAGDFDHQDIRDDRVYTYLDLPPGGKKQIQIRVNNAYLGRFYLPMITARVMYDPDLQAVIPGRWINIEP